MDLLGSKSTENEEASDSKEDSVNRTEVVSIKQVEFEEVFPKETIESESRKLKAWIARTQPSEGVINLPDYHKEYDHFVGESLLFLFAYSRLHVPDSILQLMVFFQSRLIEIFTQRELRMSKVVRVNDWFNVDILFDEKPLKLYLVQLDTENLVIIKSLVPSDLPGKVQLQ
jgi:hypothetical protein